jgi:hypothetical protein
MNHLAIITELIENTPLPSRVVNIVTDSRSALLDFDVPQLPPCPTNLAPLLYKLIDYNIYHSYCNADKKEINKKIILDRIIKDIQGTLASLVPRPKKRDSIRGEEFHRIRCFISMLGQDHDEKEVEILCRLYGYAINAETSDLALKTIKHLMVKKNG